MSYSPLKHHECNYYCTNNIHAVGMLSPSERDATMEQTQRELDILTDSRLKVHEIKLAPELTEKAKESGTWTPNDGTRTTIGYMIFVSIREEGENECDY